jgi:signal transduction histidine kinase
MLDRFHAARRRLLVVDDNTDIREQIAELLQNEGFDVVGATDGEDALFILRRTPSFDLILLDLLLPKVDGWQFRVVQRADPLLCSIPVVAMSASTSAHAKAIDADAYVSKPFEPDALIGAVRHVLERHRSSQTDRLTSLGRMAAGIAHEVNNPLTYIYASLALADTALVGVRRKGSLTSEADSSKIDDAVDSIHRALEGVDRIRAIMSGVRLLIQAPDERRGLIDIRDVIESSLAIVEHEAKKKARVAKILDEVPIVSGNPGQLCQLIVNLVANALDSMTIGDATDHCLTIRTSSTDGEAVIEVEDTGVGLPEDARGRIFEPFFTTKPPGVGTGLGLSICHGIARSHGGSIEVESEPGRGSCFRVRLPGAHAPEAARPSARPGPRRPRLLVVEDDVRVADALGQVLEQKYETTVVHAGEAALEFLEKPGNPKPDIILCDMFLGSMTGQDIYERLRRTHPPIADRMIFMTGAAFTDRARTFFDEIPNPCLEKPFQPADFEKAIGRLPSRSRTASRTRMRAVNGEGPSRSKGRTRSR